VEQGRPICFRKREADAGSSTASDLHQTDPRAFNMAALPDICTGKWLPSSAGMMSRQQRTKGILPYVDEKNIKKLIR